MKKSNEPTASKKNKASGESAKPAPRFFHYEDALKSALEQAATMRLSKEQKEANLQRFIGNLICVMYEELEEWAKDFAGYTPEMMKKVGCDFQDADIFALHYFFCGWKQAPSGIQNLVNAYGTKVSAPALQAKAMPLLKSAFLRINEARVAQGLPAYDYEAEFKRDIVV